MKKIIAYKGFDKDLKCRDFQYEIGKSYVHQGRVIPCESGFHACENPMDVFDYYAFDGSNRFCEVELSGEIHKKDNKSCAAKIKINAEIKLPEIIRKTIDFVFNIAKLNANDSAKLASSGDYAQLASSGDSAQLASSGYSAKLASSGYSAQLASSGDYAQLASSGYSAKLASSGYSAQLASSGDSAQLASSGYSAKLASSGYSAKLASSGDYAQLASSGDSAQLASSGDYAKLASSGYSAKLASSGYSAQLESKGENSVLAGIGINNIARGVIGNWIVLAEYDEDKKVSCVKAAQIDGKKIKANTWYKVEKGKFKEVE